MILAPTNRRIIRPGDKPSFEHTQRYGLIKDHPLGPAGGLILFTPFNEGSGRKVFDLSGNRINGDFVNSPIWLPGDFGSAVDFTATSSQYIDFGDQVLYEFPSQKLTLCVWFKTTQSAGMYPPIIGKGYLANTQGYGIYLNSDISHNLEMQARSVLAETTAFVDCGIVNDGLMHFAALVLDYQTIYCYVDGIFKGTDTNVGITDLASNSNFAIATKIITGTAGYYFDGLISLALLYNSIKSASEIAELTWNPFCMVQKKAAPVYFFAPEIAPPVGIPILRRRRAG